MMSRLNIVHDTRYKCCSHGARCYASHCVCSNNICHKCSLRCNSHSQPGLLIYSFVPYRRLEIGALMSMGVWI
ncbi:hypothetical protein DV515_00013208 [Chloebia gouldiae]|uniref:Uncharacterized protein n=1 Tax=Chloebia gouldiae TaxID=44316 RepID=A0A3L8S1T4_CHLGU|nr:hypothetical protein DV515_00013208 [Chloebia gouldiae]